LQIVEQGAVFAGLGTLLRAVAFDGFETVLSVVTEAAKVVALSSDCFGRLMSLEDAQSVVNGFDEGCRAGEKGFGQCPGEETCLAGIGARSVGVKPDLVEFLGDGILFETGLGDASLWLFAFGPVRSDFLLHVFGVAMPTNDELLHGLLVEVAVRFDSGGLEEPN